MKNVQLPSGLMKVERTAEEKRRSFSSSGQYVQKIKNRISQEITDVIVKGSSIATGEKKVKRR